MSKQNYLKLESTEQYALRIMGRLVMGILLQRAVTLIPSPLRRLCQSNIPAAPIAGR